MDIRTLEELPPWDWPQEAPEVILATIADRNADPSDRLLATSLAGDATVVGDEMAAALLTVAADPNEPEDLRCLAAISLGPGLEYFDTMPDEDDGLSPEGYKSTQDTLWKLFLDASVPKRVKRSVLEASVRGRQDWHVDAVRDAYASSSDWKQTAVFCMRFVNGFEQSILEALSSKDPETQLQAVHAAGAWEMQQAGPVLKKMLTGRRPEKSLLLAAIESAGSVLPDHARELVSRFVDDQDDDVSSSAWETLSMLEGPGTGQVDLDTNLID